MLLEQWRFSWLRGCGRRFDREWSGFHVGTVGHCSIDKVGAVGLALVFTGSERVAGGGFAGLASSLGLFGVVQEV